MNTTHTTKKGFALAEIIILFSLLATASLESAREKARIASFKAQVHSIQPAAILACDESELIVGSGGNLFDSLNSGNVKNVASLKILAQSCGAKGAGTFTLTTKAIGLDSSAASRICMDQETTITADEVNFPPGC